VSQLETRYRVHPIMVRAAHGGTTSGSPTKIDIANADAEIAPVAASAFTSADNELKTLPLRSTLALGTPVGKE